MASSERGWCSRWRCCWWRSPARQIMTLAESGSQSACSGMVRLPVDGADAARHPSSLEISPSPMRHACIAGTSFLAEAAEFMVMRHSPE